MSEATTRIGPSGRIVIPSELRKAIGIGVGDEVILRVENGEIRLMGRARAVRRAQDLVRRHVSPERSLSEELIGERRAESNRE